jgi:hypothetical protein
VGLAVKPKVVALVYERFLCHFPYMERIQEGYPRGGEGSCKTHPGPLLSLS